MLPSGRTFVVLLVGLPLAAAPMATASLAALVFVYWAALVICISFDAYALSRVRLNAVAHLPQVAPVGGEVEVGIRLSRDRGVALRTTIRAQVSQPLVEPEPVRAAIREEESSAKIFIPSPRRGRGTLEALWLRTEGPFGLVSKIDRVGVDSGVVDIVPDIARVAKTVLEHLGAEPMLGGLKRDPWAGHGGEFESLQAYVQGMDPRDVDWKSSARRQAVLVRRFQLERRQRVILSIDIGRSMRDPIDGLDRIDHAVHTSLALARAALLAGDLVGLHAYAEKPAAFIPPRAGTAQLHRLRRGAASLTARPEETNHLLGLRDLLLRLDRRSLVLVFTEFGDATTAELMVDIVGQLARRNLVVFVALDDPLLTEPLDEEPSNTHALATSVVAATLGERRLEVLARLRARGAHVIHARPGLVAGRVIERYLEVKRKGLLG